MQGEYVTREEFELTILNLQNQLDKARERISDNYDDLCTHVSTSMEEQRLYYEEHHFREIGVLEENFQHRMDVIAEYKEHY